MPLNIYYVDDEPALLEMFADTFAKPDRNITTFTDARAVIAATLKAPPDVLFIDFRLPQFTGEDIAKAVDAKIPKVLITGDMDVNKSPLFIEIFEKPFDPEQIESLLVGLDRSAN